MQALIFQQMAEENAGTVLQWLSARGHGSTIHHWYSDSNPPDLERADLLVLLGGAMNVDEIDRFPWLKAEKVALAAWLKSGKPVLGLCLGAQLLAQALGGRVTKAEERETGFQEIWRCPTTHPAFHLWPEVIRVYQVHEDVFSLPPGCERLASSTACANQAFALGSQALGLQFHPEATAEWVRHNRSWILPMAPGRFCQHPDESESELDQRLPELRVHFFRLLDSFVSGSSSSR
jgi:GMP synthase-like glutamine amidotransferase